MILSALWAKASKYVIGIGAIFAAIAAIFLKGRESGKVSQEAKVVQAKKEAQEAKQTETIIETRHDIEAANSQLPEAPPQKVADADPSTATGKLRDDGWMHP